MIVLNLTLNGIYGFDDFNINFTYPKKIVNSIIENENLAGRERFRYKKAIILMGANATGKTKTAIIEEALLQYFKSSKQNEYEILSRSAKWFLKKEVISLLIS